LSSPGGGHLGKGGAAPGGQQYPQRLPLAAAAWAGQAVLTERLAGGPDRVQRVALGASPGGQPLGPADLQDLLAALLQEHRQPGAETARSLDRPAATAGQMGLGKAEQLLVARGVGTGRGLGQHAAKAGDRRGGQGIAVGIDADGRRRLTLPAWPSRWSSLGEGGRELASAWEQVTARQDCDGSQPVQGWTGC
jgi:hypothetical protein